MTTVNKIFGLLVFIAILYVVIDAYYAKPKKTKIDQIIQDKMKTLAGSEQRVTAPQIGDRPYYDGMMREFPPYKYPNGPPHQYYEEPLYEYPEGNLESEGEFSIGRAGYELPIHPSVGYEYIDNETSQSDQYYISQHNRNHIDADKCMAVPQTSTECINRQLSKNGNNIRDAVRTCKVNKTLNAACMKNVNGYYYPYPLPNNYSVDYPYMSNYQNPPTRKEYIVRTSLNAPKEKVLMVKLDDSI